MFKWIKYKMADKELRKMNRMELIEIIYALQQNEHTLHEENKKLQSLLDDRMIRLERSGSIAEAALDLNHIFEDAQQAAQQYLDSLQDANDQASKILADAKQKANEMKSAAEAQRRQTEDECRVMRDKADQDIQQQIRTFKRNLTYMMKKYPELAVRMQEDMKQM